MRHETVEILQLFYDWMFSGELTSENNGEFKIRIIVDLYLFADFYMVQESKDLALDTYLHRRLLGDLWHRSGNLCVFSSQVLQGFGLALDVVPVLIRCGSVKEISILLLLVHLPQSSLLLCWLFNFLRWSPIVLVAGKLELPRGVSQDRDTLAHVQRGWDVSTAV